VWLNSVHVSKTDVQLHNSMHLIFDTIKSTQLPCLPVLANIASPKFTWDATTVLELNCRRHVRDPSCMNRCQTFQFKGLLHVGLYLYRGWIRTNDIIGDLIQKTRRPGFELRRHDWMLLIRFCISQGRADAHFSCIDGGLKSRLLVTDVPSNKQWIKLWTSVLYVCFPIELEWGKSGCTWELV
jgi:hypothetical protein